MGSQGGTAVPLESGKTLNCVSSPRGAGCRMSSESAVTLVQESVVPLPAWGGDCCVLFLVSCFLSPPCILAGSHFCDCWPKRMFRSFQEGRGLGLANPQMNGAPSPPPPKSLVAVLRSPEEPPHPDSVFPPHAHEFDQCYYWPQPLTSVLSPPGPSQRTLGGGATGEEVAAGEGGLSRFWFQFLSQAPGTCSPLSAWRREASSL